MSSRPSVWLVPAMSGPDSAISRLGLPVPVAIGTTGTQALSGLTESPVMMTTRVGIGSRRVAVWWRSVADPKDPGRFSETAMTQLDQHENFRTHVNDFGFLMRCNRTNCNDDVAAAWPILAFDVSVRARYSSHLPQSKCAVTLDIISSLPAKPPLRLSQVHCLVIIVLVLGGQ